MIQEKTITHHQLQFEDIRVEFLNIGASIWKMWVPNSQGVVENVVLGWENPEEYFNNAPYLGSCVGPFANRIAKGQFSLNNQLFELSQNEGETTLHGGEGALHHHLFEVTEFPEENALVFKTRWEQKNGFPGNIDISIRYTLDEQGLTIEYTATSDEDTVINLTNHAYFNLTGNRETIEQHQIKIKADTFLGIDAMLIPKKEEIVSGAMDLRTFKTIQTELLSTDSNLLAVNGYDHCFVLGHAHVWKKDIATLWEPKSGRAMSISTSEPALQFYSGQALKQKPYQSFSGLCLETQHYPDAPNRPDFPSTVLKKGDLYQSKSCYRFFIKKDT